ncbi:MAG: hypothetical protein WBQ61_09975 [Candidatus Acidiferrum sp.]
MKSGIKRILRKSVSTLKKWSAEPPQPPPPLPDTNPRDAMEILYTSNPLFVRIMNEQQWHQYSWPSVQAAKLAKRLGFERVSFIEFGVAGGNSLIKLEAIAKTLEDYFKINIDVYGFDSGAGMPRPLDYRDMPNLWSEGYFCMDPEKLRQRLTKAQLMLGPVGETVPSFLKSRPAPVAFVSFDLDYYSSTMEAFKLFDAEESLLLPRVHCYFDDILGYSICEFNGELLAISDFNAAHPLRKVAGIRGIRYFVPERFANEMWENYYMLHIFDHKLYACSDGNMETQMPLR